VEELQSPRLFTFIKYISLNINFVGHYILYTTNSLTIDCQFSLEIDNMN